MTRHGYAMFNWTDRTNQLSRVFVETTNIDELRARRVWRLVIVLWLTWGFFTWYFWYRGYYAASRVCLIDSFTHLVILISCWNYRNYRDIMNMNLAASGFGLFFVSTSDPALAWTMFFFPVAIVVGSQLLGIRSAFLWYVVNLVGFGVFFTTTHGIREPLASSIYDQLILICAVATCLFFCCQQGEAYYRERTRNLVELSQNLQKKSESLGL